MEKRNLQSLNRIEIVGTVGRASVSKIGGTSVIRLCVATNLGYTSKDGSHLIETTWHNVTAWESPRVRDIENIRRGSAVRVTGRLRSARFTDADGSDRTVHEIVAQSIELLGQCCDTLDETIEPDTNIIPETI